MADINPSIPASGEYNTTADPKIRTALQTLVSTINALEAANLSDGAVTADKILAAAAEDLGLSQTGYVRSGGVTIDTEEARTGTKTSYDWMPTPDRVQNVVLPAGGLLLVGYQATWKETSNNTARAAIFLGSNQLKVGLAGVGSPIAQEASIAAGSANQYSVLSTCSYGLGSLDGKTYLGTYTGAVTTGQVLGGVQQSASSWLGGLCIIFADAGTYDVGVKYKASSGDVYANYRKLFVKAIGF